MDYRTLGATGTLVSSLCLGTMTFGAETDEDAAQAVLNRYLDAGGNFIDTADVYQHGVAEEIVGRWIAKRGRADDLCRGQQLHGLAAAARHPDGPAREPGADRHAAAAVQPAHPGARMGAVAPLPGRGGRAAAVVAPRWRVAEWQVEVSDPRLPDYPYGFIAEMTASRRPWQRT